MNQGKMYMGRKQPSKDRTLHVVSRTCGNTGEIRCTRIISTWLMATRKHRTKITVVRSNRERDGTKITGIIDNFFPRELRAIIHMKKQRREGGE
jgi:hypothetical protein